MLTDSGKWATPLIDMTSSRNKINEEEEEKLLSRNNNNLHIPPEAVISDNNKLVPANTPSSDRLRNRSAESLPAAFASEDRRNSQKNRKKKKGKKSERRKKSSVSSGRDSSLTGGQRPKFYSTTVNHDEGYHDLDNASGISSESISRNFLAPPFLFPSMDELSTVAQENEERRKSLQETGVPTELAPLTRKQKFTIFMLAVANFCSTVVFSCIAPFFPNEAASKGATKTEIGLIFGIFELVMFIASPIMGRYLTTIGVKFMYGAGLFITGSTSILFGLLTMAPDGAPFVGLCFAVRIVEAIGDSMFITASFAIIAYNFPGRVATIIGLLETFSGLGFTAGPALGGVLYQAGGFKLPFMILGALLFCAGLLSLPMIPAQEESPRQKNDGMLGLIKIPAVLLMCSAVLVCAICLSYLDPTLEPHLNEFHLSPSLVGLMFLLTGGVYTLTAPVWGYVIDRTKYVREIMIGGALFSMVAMFFIGPAPFLGIKKTLWLIGISQVVLGLGIGAFFIPTFKSTLDVAKENGYSESFETYGLVSGLFQSTFSMGGFCGPTIGGIAVGKIGFAWTSTILAGFNLIIAVALSIFQIITRRKQRQRLNSQGVDPEKQPILSGSRPDLSLKSVEIEGKHLDKEL